MTKEVLKYPALFLFLCFTIFIHYMVKNPLLSGYKPGSIKTHTGVVITTGKESPPVSLENLKEEKISLSDYKEKKMVALYFWSNIPPCIGTLDELQKFYDKYKEKVEVLAINEGDVRLDLEKFSKSKNYTFNILVDQGAMAADMYQIHEPVFILIDKKGIIVYIYRQTEFSPKFKDVMEKEVIPLIE